MVELMACNGARVVDRRQFLLNATPAIGLSTLALASAEERAPTDSNGAHSMDQPVASAPETRMVDVTLSPNIKVAIERHCGMWTARHQSHAPSSARLHQ
jgi:hypothetical protein